MKVKVDAKYFPVTGEFTVLFFVDADDGTTFVALETNTNHVHYLPITQDLMFVE